MKKIPFGLRVTDQRMVDPSEVQNGAKCDCVCPGCGVSLVAKQGEVTEWHFAHAVGAECVAGVESALHRMGKQLILDRQHIWVPRRSFSREINGPYDDVDNVYHWKKTLSVEVQSEGLVSLTDCAEEKQVETRRPDILANLDGKPIAIEVAYTHFCDDEKIEWLKERKLTTLEIDVEMPPDILQGDIRSELEKRLFSPTYFTKWLNHGADDEAIAQLEEEELQFRASNSEADAIFKKVVAGKHIKAKRKADFKESIRDIDFTTFKISANQTLRIAHSKIRCTLKWYGYVKVVSDVLSITIRELAARYDGRYNEEYGVWEYRAPEERVEGLYKEIVAYIEGVLHPVPQPAASPVRSLEGGGSRQVTPVVPAENIPIQFTNEAAQEAYCERAAIMEFDCKLSRSEAERLAYEYVMTRMLGHEILF